MFECCTSARMYVNEGRNLDYPNPHVFGCFVHTIADRLSQCTRGGIIKIWYELGDLNKEFIKSPPEYGTGKVIWEQTNSQQTQTLDQTTCDEPLLPYMACPCIVASSFSFCDLHSSLMRIVRNLDDV